MKRIITLTTDFGLKDPYQGIMKGVILSINPAAGIVDLTHGISPGKILEGALAIDVSYGYFPPETIHIGVVDPGVGGSRRPIVVEAEGHFFVGPDNGLFSPVLKKVPRCRVFHLTNKRFFLKNISATFHGRDIFAPVAAHLSLGVSPQELGEPIEDPFIIDIPEPNRGEGLVTGEVIHIDTFGNLITNITAGDVEALGAPSGLEVFIKGFCIKGIKRTYCEAGSGPLALIGSSGRLEIAFYGKSAAETLDVSTGERVEVRKG